MAHRAGDGDENTQLLGRVTDRLWSDGISNIQIGASVRAGPLQRLNGSRRRQPDPALPRSSGNPR